MIYKINPSLKEYIWAGTKLKSKYNKKCNLEKVSEAWEFSINDSGLSTIDVNQQEMTLREYMANNDIGKNLRGRNVDLLIKLIDSDDSLSIQVHPSDEYAVVHYNKLGKTEMWYIVDCEEGAYIYLGFNADYTRDEVEKALLEGTIEEMLNKVYVKPGAFYSIPSGTIHAIGKGITIYEIQENSDLTFRLFDYNRTDKFGNKRELHIEESLNVLNYKKYEISDASIDKHQRLLAANKYFELQKFNLFDKYTLKNNESSFEVVTVIKGQLKMNGLDAKRGDSFYVDPQTHVQLEGKAELLIARVGDYGIGLDVGGTSVKGMIINDQGLKIAETKVPTILDSGIDSVCESMNNALNSLLEKSGMPKKMFKKIGVGFPGSVNSATGIVMFSNNLGLRNANIKEAFEKISGIETIVENDANAAALGEYFYTDKRNLHDMVMITLGTGVGSGIIIGGKLFKGGQGSMTELGHMKVKSDPIPCTCGQYGCIEALISLARIKMDVEKIRSNPSTGLSELMSETDSALKIFDFDTVNDAAREYVRKYQNNLLLALENICNIFQPEVIAIGGGVSYVVKKYFPILESKMNKYKFSGFDAPKVRLVHATLGNEAGAYGAVALTKVEE